MSTKRQHHAIATYRSTLEYFEGTKHVFPSEVPVIVKRLKATVQEMDTLIGTEDLLRIQATLKMLEVPLHKMREQHMLPLSRLARQVFKGESALLVAIRVPHKHATADAIITAALRMVEALTPHRRVLKSARIDPARLTRLKAEAKSLQRLARRTGVRAADRGVPKRRIEELFSSAHEDVMSLQSLVKACPAIGSGEQDRFASISRIGKMRGRPSKRRQQHAARKNGA